MKSDEGCLLCGNWHGARLTWCSLWVLTSSQGRKSGSKVGQEKMGEEKMEGWKERTWERMEKVKKKIYQNICLQGFTKNLHRGMSRCYRVGVLCFSSPTATPAGSTNWSQQNGGVISVCVIWHPTVRLVAGHQKMPQLGQSCFHSHFTKVCILSHIQELQVACAE